MGKTRNMLRIASRYGHHEAKGWFAITALVAIVLIFAGAGVLSIPSVASTLILWWGGL